MPTKRTIQIAAARPMTGAEAFEAGRRAYEAAADWPTGAAVPTAEPPAVRQSRYERSTRSRPDGG